MATPLRCNPDCNRLNVLNTLLLAQPVRERRANVSGWKPRTSSEQHIRQPLAFRFMCPGSSASSDSGRTRPTPSRGPHGCSTSCPMRPGRWPTASQARTCRISWCAAARTPSVCPIPLPGTSSSGDTRSTSGPGEQWPHVCEVVCPQCGEPPCPGLLGAAGAQHQVTCQGQLILPRVCQQRLTCQQHLHRHARSAAALSACQPRPLCSVREGGSQLPVKQLP